MIRSALMGDNVLNARFCHGISVASKGMVRAVDAKEAKMSKFIYATTLVVALASPALALEPLNKDAHVTESLVAVRVGDAIRNTCPSISARMFTVLAKWNDLKSYLRDKGYTEDQVEAFRKDKLEKARIKGLAADYLKAAGAVEGDVESYCKVGRDEIAKGTLAGSLLRSYK